MLRLRARWRRLQLRHAARQRDLPRGAQAASPRAPASSSTSGPAVTTPAQARLRDVLEAAIACYHAVLTSPSPASRALDYLHDRGSRTRRSGPTSSAGPPSGWDTMSRTAPGQAQRDPEELAEAGLTRGSGRAGVAPTTASASGSSSRSGTTNGSAIGFGGRALIADGDTPATTDANTSTRRPRRSSTRAGPCTSSTRPRGPFASRARPSSSRATPTR